MLSLQNPGLKQDHFTAQKQWDFILVCAHICICWLAKPGQAGSDSELTPEIKELALKTYLDLYKDML